MILFELIRWTIKRLGHLAVRPVIWVITARDCRHCAWSNWCMGAFGREWFCARGYEGDCLGSPWRPCFVRRRKNDEAR